MADLDEDALRDIARTTGGRFFRAADTGTIESAFAAIDSSQKIEFQAKSYLLTTELFTLARRARASRSSAPGAWLSRLPMTFAWPHLLWLLALPAALLAWEIVRTRRLGGIRAPEDPAGRGRA